MENDNWTILKKKRSVRLLTKRNYSNLFVYLSKWAIIFYDSLLFFLKYSHDVIVKVCYLYVE